MPEDKSKPTAGTSAQDKKEGEQKGQTPVDTAAQEDAAKEREKTGGYQ